MFSRLRSLTIVLGPGFEFPCVSTVRQFARVSHWTVSEPGPTLEKTFTAHDLLLRFQPLSCIFSAMAVVLGFSKYTDACKQIYARMHTYHVFSDNQESVRYLFQLHRITRRAGPPFVPQISEGGLEPHFLLPFSLRGTPPGHPSRLEYHDSQDNGTDFLCFGLSVLAHKLHLYASASTLLGMGQIYHKGMGTKKCQALIIRIKYIVNYLGSAREETVLCSLEDPEGKTDCR